MTWARRREDVPRSRKAPRASLTCPPPQSQSCVANPRSMVKLARAQDVAGANQAHLSERLRYSRAPPARAAVCSCRNDRARSTPAHYLAAAGSCGGDRYWKMLTARAATRSTVSAEIADSQSIKSLTRRVRGIASVGLKAIEFVNDK